LYKRVCLLEPGAITHSLGRGIGWPRGERRVLRKDAMERRRRVLTSPVIVVWAREGESVVVWQLLTIRFVGLARSPLKFFF
jgi:hypothetical protein